MERLNQHRMVINSYYQFKFKFGKVLPIAFIHLISKTESIYTLVFEKWKKYGLCMESVIKDFETGLKTL